MCHKHVNKCEIIIKFSPFYRTSYATYLALIGQLKWLRNNWLFLYCLILLNYIIAKLRRILALQTRILRLRSAATRPPDLNVRRRSAATRPLDVNSRPCSVETCPLFWKNGNRTSFWNFLSFLFVEYILYFYSSISFADVLLILRHKVRKSRIGILCASYFDSMLFQICRSFNTYEKHHIITFYIFANFLKSKKILKLIAFCHFNEGCNTEPPERQTIFISARIGRFGQIIVKVNHPLKSRWVDMPFWVYQNTMQSQKIAFLAKKRSYQEHRPAIK